MSIVNNQRTIKNKVSIHGVGLHTGELCKIHLSPKEVNGGIRFFHNSPDGRGLYELSHRAVIDTTMATTIGGYSASISTVEHLLSALHGMGIDNCDITVEGDEIPIIDGSSLPFVRLIQSAGIKDFDEEKNLITLDDEHTIEEDGQSIHYRPMPGLMIDFTIEFDNPIIGNQFYHYNHSEENYINEIAPARTFGFLKDKEKAESAGLIKGVSLENTVVIDRHLILNPEGLRFKDAFVRHKILDFIGDLFTMGNVRGHFIVNRSGHGLNNLFLRQYWG